MFRLRFLFCVFLFIFLVGCVDNNRVVVRSVLDLNDLRDVNYNNPDVNQVLIWDGNLWVEGDVNGIVIDVNGLSFADLNFSVVQKVLAGSNVSVVCTGSDSNGLCTVSSSGGGFVFSQAMFDGNFNRMFAEQVRISDVNLTLPGVWSAIDGNRGISWPEFESAGDGNYLPIGTYIPPESAIDANALAVINALDLNNSLSYLKTVDLNGYMKEENFDGNINALDLNNSLAYVKQDTNTFTKCGDTNSYLLGSGVCVPYDADTVYLPSAVKTISGTDVNNNSLPAIYYYDNNSYTVQEATGANPLTVDVNFSDVNRLDSISMRIKYQGGQGHQVSFSVYNFVDAVWEQYALFTDMNSLSTDSITIFDSNEHISGGTVWTRFSHIQNGIPIHYLLIDFVQAVKGKSTLTNIDHDSLSGRNSTTNHPLLLPKSDVNGYIDRFTYGSIDFNSAYKNVVPDLNGFWNQSRGDANVNLIVKNAIDGNKGLSASYQAGANIVLDSDGNKFSVNDANLALSYYKQDDGNAVLVKKEDYNVFWNNKFNSEIPFTVAEGGTGFSSITQYRVPYATATNTLGTSADLTYNGSTLTSVGAMKTASFVSTFFYAAFSMINSQSLMDFDFKGPGDATDVNIGASRAWRFGRNTKVTSEYNISDGNTLNTYMYDGVSNNINMIFYQRIGRIDFYGRYWLSTPRNWEISSDYDYGYTAGDTIDYNIYAYKTLTSGVTSTTIYSFVPLIVPQYTIPDNDMWVNLTWLAPYSTYAPTGYTVCRRVNGGAAQYTSTVGLTVADYADAWTLGCPVTTKNATSYTYLNYLDGTQLDGIYTSSLRIGSYRLTTLSANNKVSDSDLWDGYQFADYINQPMKTTSSPTFANTTVSAITQNKMVKGGASGLLSNSSVTDDGTTLSTSDSTFSFGDNNTLLKRTTWSNGGLTTAAVELDINGSGYSNAAISCTKVAGVNRCGANYPATTDINATWGVNGSQRHLINVITTDLTLTKDYYHVDGNATSGTITVTLPTCNAYSVGLEFIVKSINAGSTLVLNPAADSTIDGSASISLSPYAWRWVTCNGKDWDIIGMEMVYI